MPDLFRIHNSDRDVKPLEANNKKSIMRFLKTLTPDGYFFGVQQGMLSKAGIADIVGLYQGQFVALEVKSALGGPTATQKAFLKLIVKAGGMCGIVKCVADVKELLNISDKHVLSGVAEGSRNTWCNTLKIIYSKFLKPSDVFKILYRWNQKNRPPLSDMEIQEAVNRKK
uniref:VRR-NUC domain-containing protein n=1 Tax=viral metagenome TaxID=1070528 RepID=A0A6M3JW76_9ZZZZ